MPNRTEARPAKAALTNATGRLPLLRLFSTPLIEGFERYRLIATVNDLNNQPRPTATFLRCLHLD
jgi:hypothetical protein